MDREARIKLIAEGASRAASDVRGVSGEVGKLGGMAGKAQGVLKELRKSAFRMASDAARAMNDVKPLNFAQAADSAKRFDDVVTRMAIRANKDVGTLKQQFKDTGKELGIMPDRIAQTARALTKMTGSADAADAMKALGIEANDTDRSIEEMTELGATLYSKLGVPMDKIGDAFRKARSTANEFSTVGGHLALEDSLVRLAPLLARVAGGVNRATATLAVLGQGKSAEVAQETSGSILSTLEGLDPLLLTRKMRQITRDRNYKPYETDAAGRVVLKREVPGVLQRHFRKLPRTAIYGLFGRSMQGVQAAETFLSTDLSQIPTEEARLELEEDIRADAQRKARQNAQHRPGGARPLSDLFAPGTGNPSQFAATRAGERAQADVEREVVSQDAGEVIQNQRDKRNQAYKGHRGAQLAVDTVKQYLPSTAERVIDIVEAAGVEGKHRIESSRPSASGAPVTVHLDTASMKGLSDALRNSPPIVRPGKSAAAQAVEDSKAKGRAAANF